MKALDPAFVCRGQTALERFDALREHGTTEQCWLWTGSTNAYGYGCLRHKNRHWLAHRWMYEVTAARVPTGMHLDHLCNTPACVNPWHLEVVTEQENSRRAVSRRRTCRRGHPRNERNTLRKRNGGHQCRECEKITRKAS